VQLDDYICSKLGFEDEHLHIRKRRGLQDDLVELPLQAMYEKEISLDSSAQLNPLDYVDIFIGSGTGALCFCRVRWRQ
jgi:hypothetical protein